MTPMTSTLGDTQQTWAEYYRLRSRARTSLLAFVVAAFFLPILIGVLAHTLRPSVELAVFLLTFGIIAIVCAVPLFKWANWVCPRCGKTFAEPKLSLGYYSLIPVLWRLALDSRCGSCKLPCGASAIEGNSYESVWCGTKRCATRQTWKAKAGPSSAKTASVEMTT